LVVAGVYKLVADSTCRRKCGLTATEDAFAPSAKGDKSDMSAASAPGGEDARVRTTPCRPAAMSERGLPILEERLRTLKQFRQPRLGTKTAIAPHRAERRAGRHLVDYYLVNQL
jgi:hypothetical protein